MLAELLDRFSLGVRRGLSGFQIGPKAILYGFHPLDVPRTHCEFFNCHVMIFSQLARKCQVKLAGKLNQEYHTFMEHTVLASMGGKARAKKLTKKRRREIAQMGGKAGGRGRKKAPTTKRGKAAA